MALVNYRRLLSEKEFLKVKIRAMRLTGADIVDILYSDREVIFKTKSGTTPGKIWIQRIQITALLDFNITPTTKNLDKVIRESGLKVYCNCVSGDTLVTTDKGKQPIKDLQRGTLVKTSKGYKPLAGVKKSMHFAWLEIQLSNGKTLDCTKNHEFVLHGGHSIKAKDVEPKKVMLRGEDGKFVGVVNVTEWCGLKMFYDASFLEDPHDYFTEGVLSHNCPAFLYWGFKYIAWKKGYGLIPEYRRPKVRNPNQRGFVCFVGDTRVLTVEGYKPISSLKVGDLVFTGTGELKPVVAWKELDSDELVSIRIGKNKWITSTPEHKHVVLPKLVTTNNANRQKWDKISDVKASDIKEGDFLVSTLLKLESKVSIDSNKAWFLGLYLSDGSMYGRSRIGESSFLTVDGLTCEKVNISLCFEHLDKYIAEFERRGVPVHRSYQTSDNGGVIEVKDREFVEFCIKYGGRNSVEAGTEKSLNSEVLFWDKLAKAELVAGFFCGDGTAVNGSGGKGMYKAYLKWYNTNYQVMSMIHLILNEDFIVDMSYYDREEFEENGKIISPKRMYQLLMTGRDAKTWADNHPFEVSIKGSGEFTFSEERPFMRDRKMLRQVKEIKYLEKPCKVYSIEVAEDHSYIAEGIVTKNCKHIYQVMTLYPFLANTIGRKLKYLSSKDKKLDRKASKDLSKYKES